MKFLKCNLCKMIIIKTHISFFQSIYAKEENSWTSFCKIKIILSKNFFKSKSICESGNKLMKF